MRCDLCGRDGGRTILTGSDRRHALPGLFAVVACPGCGLARTEPRPGDPSAWYPPGYRQHTSGGGMLERASAAALRAAATRPGATAGVVTRLVPSSELGGPLEPGARVLDVGAGNGAAVAALRRAGLDAWGIEPSEAGVAAARARGLETVVLGTLEESPLRERSWDLVRFAHSLEHVPSPLGALRAARAALAPKGRVVVHAPNFASAGRGRFGADWDGLELPRHLHHLTPETLRLLLWAADLEPVLVRTEPLFGVLSASLDARRARGGPQNGWGRRLPARLASYPAEVALALAGTGSGLTAVARRP